jgi:membrane protease YdiL (CAAX protease family)
MEIMTVQTQPKRTFFARVFISSAEPRLRAGWRLILQTIMMAVIFFGIIISPYRLLEPPTGSNFDMVTQVTLLAVFTLTVFIARRFLDKRSFESLGFTINRQTLIDVLAGFVIAFVIMGLTYLTETAMGWLKFESFAWQVEPLGAVISSALMFLALYILVGWNEELLFRGYQLQTLASGLNLFWAVIISSAVFGIAHLLTPNATWVGVVGVFFAALFLAYSYVRTHQLWLPIGLHIGWNFFEGVVFGFRVSGNEIDSVIRHKVTGPELWTGGLYGPEAGLIILPGLVVGMTLVYAYTRYIRQNNT